MNKTSMSVSLTKIDKANAGLKTRRPILDDLLLITSKKRIQLKNGLIRSKKTEASITKKKKSKDVLLLDDLSFKRKLAKTSFSSQTEDLIAMNSKESNRSNKKESKIFVSNVNVDSNSIESKKPTKTNKNEKSNKESIIENDEGKMLKSVSTEKNKNLEKKVPHPETSKMVINCINFMKKRNVTNFEDMQKYMEKNYLVDKKVLKSYIIEFLKTGVDIGVFEKIKCN